jgi:hypothetical protein
MNEMDFLFKLTGEIPVPETIGTLNLKIARLEQRLQVLKLQQRLSSPYPAHKADLMREYSQLEVVLHELVRRRQEFLQAPLAI